MRTYALLIIVMAAPLLVAAVWSLIRYQRRQDFIEQPFPLQWDTLLREKFPIYGALPDPIRFKLKRMIRIFIAKTHFEACGGLDLVTDEMRVLIAAQACLLVVNHDQKLYPKLKTILIYPSTYKTNHSDSLFHFMEEESEARLGESWSTGTVVLAWDSVEHGAYDTKDGHNLVMHEFAHQLDQLDGTADGAPDLGEHSRYISWARVLGQEYEDLEERLFQGKDSVFDAYGATDPAEFFAVVTETFFEKPKQMKKRHPELYDQFRNFYKLDPLEWS
ncbi:MAG: M90 family metallopeptidase [Verrucomicrobiota bacterium]